MENNHSRLMLLLMALEYMGEGRRGVKNPHPSAAADAAFASSTPPLGHKDDSTMHELERQVVETQKRVLPADSQFEGKRIKVATPLFDTNNTSLPTTISVNVNDAASGDSFNSHHHQQQQQPPTLLSASASSPLATSSNASFTLSPPTPKASYTSSNTIIVPFPSYVKKRSANQTMFRSSTSETNADINTTTTATSKHQPALTRELLSPPSHISELFACPNEYCFKMYKNFGGLKYHLEKGSCCSAPSEQDKPYICEKGCGKRFKNRNGLKVILQR